MSIWSDEGVDSASARMTAIHLRGIEEAAERFELALRSDDELLALAEAYRITQHAAEAMKKLSSIAQEPYAPKSS